MHFKFILVIKNKNGAFPYLASLGFCNATIISDKWLVTAAHCFDGKTSCHGLITIKRPLLDIKVEYDKVVKHPEYEWFLNKVPTNDIALVRLKEPLKFSNEVKAINLPQNTVDNGSDGLFLDEVTSLNLIMRLHLTVLSSEESIEYFNGIQKYLIRDNLCTLVKILLSTKTLQDKPGPCGTDAGGPLVQKKTLIGVSSFVHQYGELSPKCYRLYFFTNIANYVDWIHSVIQRYSL